ncbi:MAG TPA: tRNA dihydrouridine synthase DusB [Aggregatilineaceae bacterium]|nr:tRNA dihydrouridine synthase DusB [Aggregatilineaceae bacterium]
MMLRIGNSTLESCLMLSPIARYCDLPFRLVIRPLGGLGLAFTDLVNPRGLLRRTVKSMELIETEPADRPLGVQLYGSEPDQMAEAARWCADQLDPAVIDINMGCPVDKVCKKNAGSALLRDTTSAVNVASEVVKAVSQPVTVKMRLGWDDSIVAPQLAARLEEVGVAAITVHGRTAAQAFRGRVALDGIARVVAAVRCVPVIGNGDVKSVHDAAEMMRRTGCAGVMIGRAALANPWIFRDTHAYLTSGKVPPGPSLEERVQFVRRHFAEQVRIRGERRAAVVFRQRITWYQSLLGASAAWRERFRHLANVAQFEELMEELPSNGALPLSG